MHVYNSYSNDSSGIDNSIYGGKNIVLDNFSSRCNYNYQACHEPWEEAVAQKLPQ